MLIIILCILNLIAICYLATAFLIKKEYKIENAEIKYIEKADLKYLKTDNINSAKSKLIYSQIVFNKNDLQELSNILLEQIKKESLK